MAELSPIDVAMFWSRVAIENVNACWYWTGGTSGVEKYGVYKGAMAHRVAYALIHGPIPDGIVIRHICDMPRCCNPRHLLAGTQGHNMADAVRRERIRRGQRHGRAKLTNTDVAEIRANSEGLPQKVLAQRFGVSPGVICNIINRRTWRHLP